MHKSMLLNEIKLMELKLHELKTQVESAEHVKEHSTANLYGLLDGSDDITAEDIEAVNGSIVDMFAPLAIKPSKARAVS